ncbi:glycoside hydrolase family 47 protein [Xylariaceae sp. FL0662B]|nr:glycoside hydrolase family 47 protein [Xylariaceae sp. FL0662B]
MMRLRVYRYYVFFAAVFLFLLYHTTRKSEQWEPVSAPVPYTKAPPKAVNNKIAVDESGTKASHKADDLAQQRLQDVDEEPRVKLPVLKPTTVEDDADKFDLPPTPTPAIADGQTKVVVYDKDGAAKTTVAPLIDIPDKKVGQGAKGVGIPAHGVPGGKNTKDHTTTTTIHWTKMPEHFPVAEGDIIPLPTGKPQNIPAVQHNFEKESRDVRQKRVDRLAKVKAEMTRGWRGYIKYAKGHDELSPVSKKFRDPFCGWAATLVDTLDTLWIMGMTDEFEEALREVEKIDFTTTEFRSEIPVFETTIRYLGGLVAAYDVSGQLSRYEILLKKAVELAEILMGIFDTPNRMPILYYNWKPASASQPKRAGSSVSIAELGSLAMEFTRLAQITKENKYYDAVARITDALYEWEERGTSIPGIFPERVDATGCNRTAEALAAAKEAALKEEQQPLERRSSAGDLDGEDSDGGKSVASKKQKLQECIPQGLAPSGYGEQYSMGGSQDSTYEYFPKQWLLLGGLEPKYKTLHLKTAEAVKKWLLYRPMIPDNRDILFSAKINTQGDPQVDALMEWEVTHLTCFIGGMFGLGGKIFDVPEDVEIAKKLTDGCIWAYETTPSGIMPEGASVVPCAGVNNCHWNETLYWEWLDPLFASRNAQIEDFENHQKELKLQREKEKEDKRLRAAAAEMAADARQEDESHRDTFDDSSRHAPEVPNHRGDDTNGLKSGKVQKRAPPAKITTSSDRDSASDGHDGASESTNSNKLEKALDMNPDSNTAMKPVDVGAGQIPLQEAEEEEFPEPQRPLSHEEYVQTRIKNENIPRGFVNVNYRRYILRPEAIESVWYMYRITGDSYWQDKGWRMFNAIVSQTRTEAGNSAIDDVLVPNSAQVDEMESFWLAETLKYFYLLYSDPSLISLDEWVLNTEAHPFKRPA